MVGVSFEIHDSCIMEKAVSTQNNNVGVQNGQSGSVPNNIGLQNGHHTDTDTKLRVKFKHIQPSVLDIILYAYCYIGLVTGTYYWMKQF